MCHLPFCHSVLSWLARLSPHMCLSNICSTVEQLMMENTFHLFHIPPTVIPLFIMNLTYGWCRPNLQHLPLSVTLTATPTPPSNLSAYPIGQSHSFSVAHTLVLNVPSALATYSSPLFPAVLTVHTSVTIGLKDTVLLWSQIKTVGHQFF